MITAGYPFAGLNFTKNNTIELIAMLDGEDRAMVNVNIMQRNPWNQGFIW